MALKCLCSDVIISNEERNTTRRFKRNFDADFFRIHRRRLIQSNVNPRPTKKMLEMTKKVLDIPESSYAIEIDAERHRDNVSYTVNFEDSEGNNLKTYYF